MKEYTGSPVEEVFAQVPLPKSQLEELKQRSGMLTTEDALQTAVNHYFSCPEISISRSESESESKREEGLAFVSGKVKKPNHWHGYGISRNWKLLAIEMEIMSQGKRVPFLKNHEIPKKK